MSVTVYSQPGCGQCMTTKMQMKKLGIEFTEIDVSKDNEAKDFVVENYGIMLPVVVTDDDYWMGFRIEKIKGILTPVA